MGLVRFPYAIGWIGGLIVCIWSRSLELSLLGGLGLGASFQSGPCQRDYLCSKTLILGLYKFLGVIIMFARSP